MTKLESIVVSNTEPNSKNVLWYDNKRLLIFSNGSWSPIVDLDDIDVDNLPGVSNLQEALKSLNIKVDNKVDKVELDEALTAKQDKLVNSSDVTIGIDSKLTVTDLAKREVFDDLWISVAGSNGTVDHTHTEDNVSKPYYLNEVWMTYEEALTVYNEKFGKADGLLDRNIRGVTNFAPLSDGTIWALTNFTAYYAKVINVGSIMVKSMVRWINNAPSATKILGKIDLYYWEPSIHSYNYLVCPSLTTINLHNLRYDFNIGKLRSISLASMQYMVNNSQATSSITVTVHPDVYAKLTGDTTNASASALTADELAQWQALVTTANSKNISFATKTA